ncbi:hypothetical protein FKQ51_31995 [Bacillus toyonensis]|nr:hypothetical protein [Bacillus toyonensis]
MLHIECSKALIFFNQNSITLLSLYRMEEDRISFQQGFKEFLIMMVCFWFIMFLMYGESLLQ